MNFEKILNVFSTQDPYQKQLQKLGIYTDSLTQAVLTKTLQSFNNNRQILHQQGIIKNLIKNLQNKGSVASKLKIISLLLQISKITQFDIADIIMTRKMKIFTKVSKLKFIQTNIDKKTIQIYICSQLIVPIYNYLMKLSVNQQLYKTCYTKSIPFDDIFRRGSNIRFIWIFKVYNLISIIMPILQSIIKIIKIFPNLQFCKEISTYLYDDLIIMNNFIVIALNQAAHDNYLVMPYFDMLQFYQSLTQQFKISQKVNFLYKSLINICNSNQIAITNNTIISNTNNTNTHNISNKKNDILSISNKKIKYHFQQPLKLKIDNNQIQAIQVQALRVKLISNALKNPKKDYTRLETQYQEKNKIRTIKTAHYATQFDDNKDDQFTEKYRNLD